MRADYAFDLMPRLLLLNYITNIEEGNNLQYFYLL